MSSTTEKTLTRSPSTAAERMRLTGRAGAVAFVA